MVATQTLIRLCAKTAFYVGFPIGLIFSVATILLLLFPPPQINMASINDIILGILIGLVSLIPFASGYYLWKSGKKIKEYLDSDYSTIKTSFLYILHVNIRLFTLYIFIVSTAGITYGWLLYNDITESLLVQIGFSLGGVTALFLIATLLGTLTTGMITVIISRIVLSAARSDLSLIEYAK